MLRLVLAESCFLKLSPSGGFSKAKWCFKPVQFNWHKSCLDAFTSHAWGKPVFLIPYSSYFRLGWAEKFRSCGISKRRLLCLESLSRQVQLWELLNSIVWVWVINSTLFLIIFKGHPAESCTHPRWGFLGDFNLCCSGHEWLNSSVYVKSMSKVTL